MHLGFHRPCCSTGTWRERGKGTRYLRGSMKGFSRKFPPSFIMFTELFKTVQTYSWGLGLDLCSRRVRRVVVVSSSCRRRLVVANSLISLHWAVHSHCDTILTYKCEKWRKSRAKCSFWRSGVTKSEVIFAFCVTGAILWERVNARASVFRGRRSTLWCGLSRCRGRRSISWCGKGALCTNRNGRDAQTWHYFKNRGRRSMCWVSWKVTEASQKSYFLSSVKMAL